ncbi:Cell wall protein PRY3 [Tetrabaena socialis]|uniref:Cell wall protein PRY3 n=1 Tax=Tetrabaena socialis TaxID=47790 RepID=A0A2J7ZV04_9CHLO|nr:Cell wall protein PRY3 [Tetrabaena socialis]|eukprot:PNH04104.1 Cell wall protein PRY3 [Tetrabaena socialis]
MGGRRSLTQAVTGLDVSQLTSAAIPAGSANSEQQQQQQQRELRQWYYQYYQGQDQPQNQPHQQQQQQQGQQQADPYQQQQQQQQQQGQQQGAAAQPLPAAPSSASSDALSLHNQYRAAHHAAPLSWSSSLESSAQSWASQLASGCQFSHSGWTGLGENLAAGYNTWADAAFAWYDEIRQYNYAAASFNGATGHATQMLWLATTEVGCAVVASAPGCWQRNVFVCHYTPPGNVMGQFAQNVLAPTAPLSWSSSLESSAQSWASQLASGCQFSHSGWTGLGENLAAGYNTWADAAFAWYDEIRQYNYAAASFNGATGHATQMLWLATTEVGCAVVASAPGCWQRNVFVCHYTPPGSVMGQFAQNVLAP